MSETSALVTLLGGVAVFMFGMNLASDHLKRLAENRVRDLLGRISNRNYLSIFVGVLLTIILQSSGAVTSLLVSLGRAKVVTLMEVMGVIIGTAIGSTLTVQLISFKVTEFGFGIFAFSFAVYFVVQKSIPKSIASVCMGFGMIFWGLQLMSDGTNVLRENTFLLSAFKTLNDFPIWTMLITTAFTGFVHSSAVVIGLAMSLATSGIITFHDAMYWVYGANIGTTSTALLAAIGGNYVGRRVAWAHFWYKVGSVLVLIGFTSQFVELVDSFSANIGRGIANAHTLFNILAAVIFYPFIPLGVKLITKYIVPKESEQDFKVKFLEDKIEEPLVVIAQARREALRMADIVSAMVCDSITLFKSYNVDLTTSIGDRDNQVDLLHREIKMHLVDLSRIKGLGSDILELIDFTSDLESAADVVDGGLRRLASKKHRLKLEFSKEGWSDLTQLYSGVIDLMKLSIASFELRDKELAEKVISKKRELRKLERRLRESHIERLNRRLKESMNTSEIHLDVLAEFRRISGLITNHAYNIIEGHR
ncbi:MAG: Na/Pi cotransporter family protein [Bdellovibrionales bacterium]|nr:Na/Pi cotransporter family protein [Bdellovibrionales bacterium]